MNVSSNIENQLQNIVESASDILIEDETIYQKAVEQTQEIPIVLPGQKEVTRELSTPIRSLK